MGGIAMTDRLQTQTVPNLVLRAETAAELMTANPLSIRDTATVAEAVALLTDKGFSGAPVIDEAGRPIGVLSRSDIVVHDREKTPGVSEYYNSAELVTPGAERIGPGSHAENVDRTTVRDVMTPAVFGVAPGAPVAGG